MIEDAKNLVRMMGMPIVEAPGEAEAQCSELVKNGVAYATASEDMDSLTFGSTVLIRGFNTKKDPITMINLPQVLEGFEMNMEQFIDLCILCGCDYTTTIQGVGPVKAFNFVKACGGTIEGVLKKIESDNEDPKKKQKYHIPEQFKYEDARAIFKGPDVAPAADFVPKWEKPNEEKLKEFLVTHKGFNDVKVENGIKKLNKC